MCMKNLFFVVAMAMAVVVSGCTKDTGSKKSEQNTRLVIKIGGESATRGTEATAAQNVIEIEPTRSHVFVVNAQGLVVASETLSAAALPSGGGQEIAEPVPTNSKVYVVANIPAADYTTAFKNLTNLADIKASTSAISTQTTYMKPTMANRAGTEVSIDVDDVNPELATVTVAVAPVISRLELHGVQAAATDDAVGKITAFNVAGVYVDSYFQRFAYDGLAIDGQEAIEMEQTEDFTGALADKMGDAGSWPGAGDPIAAKPTEGVWAYQVAPGGMPRFIIALTGVKFSPKGGGPEADWAEDPCYLTLTEYTGMTETAFTPGKVYRVGTAGKELVFGPDNLWPTPNPDPKAGLKVNVTVDDWTFGDYSGVLAR